MALNNCSINSQSLTKTGGDVIGSDNIQLVITPNAGYVVSSSDFINNTGVIAGVSSITLSDSGTAGTIGNTVLVNVDLDDTYVMPLNDTELVIDIDGDAALITYTLSGTYSSAVYNASPASETNTPYTGSGNNGSEETVFIKSFTADSGYYFPEAPSYILTSNNSSQYNITRQDTLDGENRITTSIFTVDFTFSNSNVLGDTIEFNAAAEEYFTETAGITSYNLLTNNIDLVGGIRTMTVFGTPGATFSLAVTNDNSNSILSLTNVTIPASGNYTFIISFPSVSIDDSYDFVLTGTQVSTNFGGPGEQPHTFTINQVGDKTITVDLQTADSTINISSPVSVTLPASTTVTSDTAGNLINTFTITSTSTLNIIDQFGNIEDFTNNDPLTNGGTFIDIDSLIFSSVSSTEISAFFIGSVDTVGTSNVTSVFDIDNYISTAAVSTIPIIVGYVTGVTSITEPTLTLPVGSGLAVKKNFEVSVNKNTEGHGGGGASTTDYAVAVINNISPADIVSTVNNSGDISDYPDTVVDNYDGTVTLGFSIFFQANGGVIEASDDCDIRIGVLLN